MIKKILSQTMINPPFAWLALTFVFHFLGLDVAATVMAAIVLGSIVFSSILIWMLVKYCTIESKAKK